MNLVYTDREGHRYVRPLTDSTTVGRSKEADIEVDDNRASRMHFAIHLEQGVPVLHDLQSRNGTHVNGKKTDIVALKPGDEIRLGSVKMFIEGEGGTGPTTALNNIQDEMESGKGYGTILREIVSDTGSKK